MQGDREYPPAHPARYPEENIFGQFIGPLGGPCSISVECVFVDPVADLAVFGVLDAPELSAEIEAYEVFVSDCAPFPVGRLSFHPEQRLVQGQLTTLRQLLAGADAYLLSLDGVWFSCRIGSRGRSLWIEEPAQPIQSGMSGSPVVLSDGSAVCVVCIDTWSNPLLEANLPARMVRDSRPPATAQ